MDKVVEMHVLFFGEVQGVGFRRTIAKMASSLKINGFVKNLSDGSVELCCIGEKAKLEEFLDKIQQNNLGRITRFQLTFYDQKNQFKKFEIKF